MTNRERRVELRAEMERRRERIYRLAPSWRTRRRRRTLAALVVTVLTVTAVGVHVQPRDIGLPLAGIVVVAALMVALRVLTRAVAETPQRDLDERDRGLRDAAWRQAYLMTLVAFALYHVYVVAIGGGPEAGNQAMRVGVAFLLGCVSAPTLALAWTLPDDDPEDLADQV